MKHTLPLQEAPKPAKIAIAVLAIVLLIWAYAAIEPFIQHFTGFGFIYDYKKP